jgi:hypothetical protein
VFSVKIVNGMPTDKKSHPELNLPNLSSFGNNAQGEVFMGSLDGSVVKIDAAN